MPNIVEVSPERNGKRNLIGEVRRVTYGKNAFESAKEVVDALYGAENADGGGTPSLPNAVRGRVAVPPATVAVRGGSDDVSVNDIGPWLGTLASFEESDVEAVSLIVVKDENLDVHLTPVVWRNVASQGDLLSAAAPEVGMTVKEETK